MMYTNVFTLVDARLGNIFIFSIIIQFVLLKDTQKTGDRRACIAECIIKRCGSLTMYPPNDKSFHE